MSIDSHPESWYAFWSKRLVRTVLGSMLTGIWVFSMEILYISYAEFFKVTCTSVQELYRSSLVCPLILIRSAAFWCKRLVGTVLGSMLTGIWVFSMEILYISYGEFFKVTCTSVQELYRSSLVCPLILIRRAAFWCKRLVCTVLGSMLTGIWVFSMEILYISYGEFFKVTCTSVQELYRSSLVCPLILIRRAAFWCKRLVCTVLGSMLTGIWVFSMEILYISYGEFFKVTCTSVQELYRSSLVCPLILIRRAAFWCKRLVCTVLGSMLTGIWVFSMEILYSYAEFFKVTCTAVQELYRSSLVCPLILIRRAAFWSKRLVRTVLGSMLTGIWVFSMEILYISYAEFFKVTCTSVQELYRSSLVCPLILIRSAAFWCNRLVCTVLGSMLTGIWVFSMEILYISYGEFFKVTCTSVQELYRSSLVCPLILNRRAAFWSKRLVRTVLGSMLTGISVFSMEMLYISYAEIFKGTCTSVQELYRSSLVCPLIFIRRAAFWWKRLVGTVLGSMLTGIWVFSMEIVYISYVEFFKVTCTSVQELYRSSLVCPLILIRRAAFWCKRLVRTVLGSMLTGIWVFSMEILYSYGEFFKVTCTAVQELYRSSLVCPLILIWRAAFWCKRLVCTVLGSMLTGIWVFSMEILYISYGEFFKVTCTSVQELYRSSLVCPLILIRRAAFWSKRLFRTVLGSMLSGIWVFSMDILYISYGELFKVTCTSVQELYRSSLVSPLILIRRAAFLVQTASLYSPGKYVNWNLVFSMEIRLYRLAVCTKMQLSWWLSMDIPDLTCTVLVRTYRWPWINPHS